MRRADGGDRKPMRVSGRFRSKTRAAPPAGKFFMTKVKSHVSAEQRRASREIARAAFAAAGVTPEQVREKLGLAAGTFARELHSGFPCGPLRDRIEAVLEYRTIWSDADTVHLRARCAREQGFDPMLQILSELKQHAPRFGVTALDFSRGRREVCAKILQHIAATPPK